MAIFLESLWGLRLSPEQSPSSPDTWKQIQEGRATVVSGDQTELAVSGTVADFLRRVGGGHSAGLRSRPSERDHCGVVEPDMGVAMRAYN